MEKELPKITVGDKDYNGKNQGEVRPEDLAKLSESKEAKERQELLEQNEILKSEKETTIDLGDYKIFVTNDSRIRKGANQGAKYQKNVDKVVETIYNLIKKRFSKEDIIGKGKRLKEIDEMTRKEYEMLEQALKDNKLENCS